MAVTKLETKKAEPSKAHDAITAIAEVVFSYSGKKPSLSDCARVASRAATMLKLGDEKEAVENNAAISIAKKYGLVS
jgi:hypothetical protein